MGSISAKFDTNAFDICKDINYFIVLIDLGVQFLLTYPLSP